MPGGDHLNIIDPPGLTVMRIAGGRYRVTAAHRVVWTWMNEFASLSFVGDVEGQYSEPGTPPLEMGDLVTLTIVDVFETAEDGKLLSYCPTFDNRAVRKTNQTAETIRKSSNKFFSLLGRAGKAVQQSETSRKASKELNKLAENVKHRVDEAVQQINSPSKRPIGGAQSKHGREVSGAQDFEQAMTAAEAAAMGASALSPAPPLLASPTESSRPNLYISAASTEDEEGSASLARV